MSKYTVQINGSEYQVALLGRSSLGQSQMLRFEIDGEVYETLVGYHTPSPTSEARSAGSRPIATNISPTPQQNSNINDKTICAPMPGIVSSIECTVGDTVQAGDTIAVIEAMKMENPIVATKNSTVVTVHVKKGDEVPANAILVTLK